MIGNDEIAPAGVCVLVVLDAFFNFGTALERVRLPALAVFGFSLGGLFATHGEYHPTAPLVATSRAVRHLYDGPK